MYESGLGMDMSSEIKDWQHDSLSAEYAGTLMDAL
jgi:hypothetical protein